jgi:amidase
MAVFTSLFNVTGQPAISVPIHQDDATGLPVGIQLVAAPWREDLLLQVSRTLELAHPWTARRPAVGADSLQSVLTTPGDAIRRHTG